MKSKVITILLAAILLINSAGIVFLIKEEKEQKELELTMLELLTYQTINTTLGEETYITGDRTISMIINKTIQIQEEYFPHINKYLSIDRYERMMESASEEQKEELQQNIDKLEEELKELND